MWKLNKEPLAKFQQWQIKTTAHNAFKLLLYEIDVKKKETKRETKELILPL